jgi:hypothetical protein
VCKYMASRGTARIVELDSCMRIFFFCISSVDALFVYELLMGIAKLGSLVRTVETLIES